MDLTEDIKKALRLAIDDAGSQSAFERLTDVGQNSLSRYLSGETNSITTKTWNKIYPYTKKYLPLPLADREILTEMEKKFIKYLRMLSEEEQDRFFVCLVEKVKPTHLEERPKNSALG